MGAAADAQLAAEDAAGEEGSSCTEEPAPAQPLQASLSSPRRLGPPIEEVQGSPAQAAGSMKSGAEEAGGVALAEALQEQQGAEATVEEEAAAAAPTPAASTGEGCLEEEEREGPAAAVGGEVAAAEVAEDVEMMDMDEGA